MSSVQCRMPVSPNMTCQHSLAKHFVSCHKQWCGPLETLLNLSWSIFLSAELYFPHFFTCTKTATWKQPELCKGMTSSKGIRRKQNDNELLAALLNTFAVSNNCHILSSLSCVRIFLFPSFLFPVATNVKGFVSSELQRWKWFLACEDALINMRLLEHDVRIVSCS